MKRRELLTGIASIAYATLGGCSVIKEGEHVYDIILDVNKVIKYTSAISVIAKAVISVVSKVGLIGAASSAIIVVGIDVLNYEIANFNTVTKGKVEVSYNNTSIKTAFDSLIDAAKVVVSDIGIALKYSISALPAELIAYESDYEKAAETLLRAIKGLISDSSAFNSMSINEAMSLYIRAKSELGE